MGEVKPDEVSEVKPDEVSEVADEVPEKTKWRNPADIDHAGSLTPDTGEQGISKEISKWVYSALRNKNKLKSTIGPIVTAATAIGLSIYPKTRPLAGPLLKEAGLETGLQTIDPSIIGERPEGGIGPDFGVQLPQSLDMDEMENYLRAAQRFEVSGDPNLETSADRMHLAFVVDEFGELLGLITLEDIISVNRGAIIKDIMNDKGIPLSEYSNFANTIGEEEMKQLFDLPT